MAEASGLALPHTEELSVSCEGLMKCFYLSPSFLDVDFVLDKLRGKFEDKWRNINFGEQVISEYIQFCGNKKEFQPAFWHVVNLNLR